MEPKKDELRDDLLVSAGMRAAHMKNKCLVDIPEDIEGIHQAATIIANAVDDFIEINSAKPDEEFNWDFYIEQFLKEHFPVSNLKVSGMHGLDPVVVKLCETVFDLAFTFSHGIATEMLPTPEDSRDTFAEVMDLAVRFESEYQDDGTYLEAIDSYANKYLASKYVRMNNSKDSSGSLNDGIVAEKATIEKHGEPEDSSLKVLERLMVQHNLAIRCLPSIVRDVVEVRHKDQFPDGIIQYLPEFHREMLLVEHIPKHAGMFIIEEAKGTGATVKYHAKEFYNSLDEIVKEYLRKPSNSRFCR